MGPISKPRSRRTVVAAGAGGLLTTAAAAASAQTGAAVPQPLRPGHGGTDLGPRNLILTEPRHTGAGDVGYIPFAMGHYIENTGDTRLSFLEIFRSSYYADVSLDQWMALTPPELVEAHLNLDQQVMSGLRKQKAPIVPA